MTLYLCGISSFVEPSPFWKVCFRSLRARLFHAHARITGFAEALGCWKLGFLRVRHEGSVSFFHCLQVFSIRVGVCLFLHWPTHRLRQGKRCHFFNDIFSFHAVVKFPITFLTHYVFIWDLQMFLFNACVFLISWRGIRIPISVRSFSTAPQAQAGRQDLSNHFSALCMLRSCFLWRWRQKFETKSGRIRVQENIPLKEKRTKVRRKSFPGSIWIQFGMQNESGNGSQKGGRKTTSFLEPFS